MTTCEELMMDPFSASNIKLTMKSGTWIQMGREERRFIPYSFFFFFKVQGPHIAEHITVFVRGPRLICTSVKNIIKSSMYRRRDNEISPRQTLNITGLLRQFIEFEHTF